jgi:hypothetical protein
MRGSRSGGDGNKRLGCGAMRVRRRLGKTGGWGFGAGPRLEIRCPVGLGTGLKMWEP